MHVSQLFPKSLRRTATKASMAERPKGFGMTADLEAKVKKN